MNNVADLKSGLVSFIYFCLSFRKKYIYIESFKYIFFSRFVPLAEIWIFFFSLLRDHQDYTLYVHNTHILLYICRVVYTIDTLHKISYMKMIATRSIYEGNKGDSLTIVARKNTTFVNGSKASNIRMPNIDLQVLKFLFSSFWDWNFLRQSP